MLESRIVQVCRVTALKKKNHYAKTFLYSGFLHLWTAVFIIKLNKTKCHNSLKDLTLSTELKT